VAGLLVRAITTDTSQQDMANLVQATAALTDIATNYPAVIDALAAGGSLQALLNTAHGQADPTTLVQILSELAQFAAGDPSALEPLLRGGDMAQLFDAMPAGVT